MGNNLNKNERLKTIAYNAIVLGQLEQNYSKQSLLVELGCTKEEFDEIMDNMSIYEKTFVAEECKYKAINIVWEDDYQGDYYEDDFDRIEYDYFHYKDFRELPTEVMIPDSAYEDYYDEIDEDAVYDYLTDEYGWHPESFKLEKID